MKALAYLIPPLLFLVASAAIEGSKDLQLTAMQAEANLLQIRMNRVSNDLSSMVQDVSLGIVEHDDLRDDMDASDAQVRELQEHLEGVWTKMDQTNVEAARDARARRVLKALGFSSAVLALIIMGGRSPEVRPHCILATSILLGFLAV
jgi:hypothetical protein